MDVTVFSDAGVRVIPMEEIDGQLEAVDFITALYYPLPRIPRAFGSARIPFGSSTCSVAFPSRTTWLSTPHRGSPGSHARYWTAHPRPTRRELLLLQYLPPNAHTSIHSHEQEDEEFFCLHGACEVLIGVRQPRWTSARMDQRIPLGSLPEDQRRTNVLRHTVHQLRTTHLPALNVILIRRTSAQTLEDLKHRPAQWA